MPQRDAMSRFTNETMTAGFRHMVSTGGTCERAFFQDPINGGEYGVVTRRVNATKKARWTWR